MAVPFFYFADGNESNKKVCSHLEGGVVLITRYIISQIYFDKVLLRVSDISIVHHQESQHCIHSNRYLSC